MSSMNAVRIHEYGGPEVLRYEQAPTPKPGPGEALIRVHAAGVNPADWKVREGYLKAFIAHPMPLILGWDVSGVVEELGEGVKAFGGGEEVFAQTDIARDGAYAEFMVCAVDRLTRKPSGIDHIAAAATPVAAMAAWQGLFGEADLQPGQTVLIHGGAGGVGSFAIQLAKWKGARVIATGSAENGAFMRELGADQVVDYRKQRFEEAVKDVDLVFDNIGGDTQARSWAIIKPGGALASVSGGEWAGAPEGDEVRKIAVFGNASAEAMSKLSELLEQGIVKPIVTSVLPLAEARQAHELSQAGHVRGKIVLRVA